MKPPTDYVLLDDAPLDTAGQGDKAGGAAKPNSKIVALGTGRNRPLADSK